MLKSCPFLFLSNSAYESVVPCRDVPYSPCVERTEDVEKKQENEGTKVCDQLAEIQTTLVSLEDAFTRISEQVNSNNKLIHTFHEILRESRDEVKDACGEQSSRIQELKTGQSEHLSVISSHVSETNISYRNLYLQLHKALVWHGENLKSTIEGVMRDRTPQVTPFETKTIVRASDSDPCATMPTSPSEQVEQTTDVQSSSRPTTVVIEDQETVDQESVDTPTRKYTGPRQTKIESRRFPRNPLDELQGFRTDKEMTGTGRESSFKCGKPKTRPFCNLRELLSSPVVASLIFCVFISRIFNHISPYQEFFPA